MKRFTFILIGTLLVFGGFTLLAHAQTYTPLAPLPFGDAGSTPATWTLTTYLTGMIKLLVALGGALAVLMLVIGGTQYVAAGINPSAKGDAKDRIFNALIGLTLVLSSYLILNSINPNLVKFDLLLPPVGGATGVAGVTVVAVTTGSLSDGTNSSVPQVTPTTSVSSESTLAPASTDTSTVVIATTTAQSIIDSRIDRNNDYSIISNCVGNTSYDLCPKTDLNGDGKTDTTDLVTFSISGNLFDVSKNGTVELADASPAVSCFFKVSTADVTSLLPREVTLSDGSGTSVVCDGASGGALLPTVECNGGTWIKAPLLNGKCAVSNGFNTMPFGFVYGGGDQFSKFQSLITGASSGSSVNLGTLFSSTFFVTTSSGDGLSTMSYSETDLGKITYASIAPYDLNNDGFADFSETGGDRSTFNTCKGSTVSGSCVEADFNQDGTIDDRDLAFINFINRDVLGSSGAILLGWILNWFESMLFDPVGYADKQIIKYCLDRTATEKCGFADMNGDRVVNSTDITVFDQSATLFDFNSDGKVDLR